MKNAFTAIELITVILIVAILTAIALPRLFVEDKLAQAAEEIITNLRYTQHLSLMEDEFDRSVRHWERHRWRMGFNNAGGHGWSYTVYKDAGGDGNNEPTVSATPPPARPCGTEIAVDPSTKKCIAGHAARALGAGGALTPKDAMTLEGAWLVANRDIHPDGSSGANSGVQFSTSCAENRSTQTIGFDELGRPFSMTGYSSGGSGSGNPKLFYFRDTCVITLTATDLRRISICIQPETGTIDYCPE
ncbi:hypothetical protein FACS189487_03110 [Campylobacterota bacterium]|nr:hypothetical protein FACS189487_03110 [Campylobacterota bacterium]